MDAVAYNKTDIVRRAEILIQAKRSISTSASTSPAELTNGRLRARFGGFWRIGANEGPNS